MSEERLFIFLKAPRPGAVKTRLAESIGASEAAAAYQILVETLLAKLALLSDVQLRFSPDDALSEIEPWLRPHWQARAQGEGDLGQRLERAFGEAFTEGVNRVVVIGSDCPELTAEDIRAAWAALARDDLVLGPAKDGGYWLIGLKSRQPSLFHSMPWSTDKVLEETLDRARHSGLTFKLLRELSDVDTEQDWLSFLAQIGKERGFVD